MGTVQFPYEFFGFPDSYSKINNANSDIYYTYSNWSTNEIDGITFIPVVKDIPDPKKNQVVHYMRKDNMEFIK